MLLNALGRKGVADLWKLTAERTRLQRQEMEDWGRSGIDVLIGPPTVTVAALHRETGDWSLGACHTMRYNLLDLPAGVVPVSTVRRGEDVPRQPGDRLDRKAALFEQGSQGLPLNVQVIGRPWREDQVLSVMQAVEDGSRSRPGFPLTPVDVD